MKQLTIVSLLMLCAVSAAVAADAPNVSQKGRHNPFVEELNLTEQQEPKFVAIQQAMTAKWAELQNMPAHERKARQAAFYKARFAELEQLLTSEQMAKYREIRAQRQKPQSRKPAANASPRRGSSKPFSLADCSGNDIKGIEPIIDEIRRAGEPWRRQAEQRIDQLRKAELEIRVVDANGKPLSGVPVHVQQQRHAFRFGGIVSGPSMHQPAPGERSRRLSPEQYKNMFLELGFNTAGFGSYLKYKRRYMSVSHLPALFAWFQEHDIPVRGHCLIWPGGTFGNFMPAELSKMVYEPDPKKNWIGTAKGVPRQKLTAREQQAVRDLCEKMVGQAARQWPVFEWDVINETRDNHIVQDLVGKAVIVDWFKAARQNTKDRQARLYLNENKVISDPAPGDVTENMKRFADEVRYLLDNGAPISALGFQSRFAKQTPPETLYRRLQYFEKFNLPIAATEFEMKKTIGSEPEKAAMTEQAMTVLFSHKLINGIYAWTILEGGRNDHRELVNSDGSLNLRGKVWMYLMKNRWWTDESLSTDANGTVRLRGFKGDYTVTAGKDTMELRLDKNRKAKITVPATEPAVRSGNQSPGVIGRKGFVHVEQEDGIWTMVNSNGEPFIPLGMNHVGPMSRFAPYNKEYWAEKIGGGILKNGRVDFKSEGAKTWLEIIAKDHKDYGFNTLAFHHPHFMPTEYCNELKLYYFGKLRMSNVHAKRAKQFPPKHFPDVFDPAWHEQLDGFVKRYTSKHRNSKYLLGYSYDDLPAYTIYNLEKRINGFEHHPWIMDIITKPGKTEGKGVWIEVLKDQYTSAAEAGKMYGLKVSSWDDFYGIKEYGMPKDQKQGFADQALMNQKIVEAYLKGMHDAIRKHDPNHLILGDKIQNARMQPDWVWEIVKDYVDVILIQDYDFFTPAHEKKLRHIHQITGKPIINGDHSYGALRPCMHTVKGVPVPTMEDKGKQYAVYLKGIMNLPFMLGWQTCGYLETCAGTSDATGKQQTGYFDPKGKPIAEALQYVKPANEQALKWHRQAGKLNDVYSSMKR